jgi:putative endonuclease
MVFWVYILECRDSTGKNMFYTGYTSDLTRRVQEHETGRGAKFTRGKTIQLRYFETLPTRQLAMRREIAIKRLPRKKKAQLVATFPGRWSFTPHVMF